MASFPSVLPPPNLTSQDVEHLKIVAILHYFAGGLFALTGFASIIHLSLGVLMLSGAVPMKPSEQAEATVIGAIFTGVALIWMLSWWMFAIVIAIGGRNLQLRRSWGFALVVALLLAIHAPLGTLLGVFTILILLRPTVKAVFIAKSPVKLSAPVSAAGVVEP
jgi:hypothetical protein